MWSKSWILTILKQMKGKNPKVTLKKKIATKKLAKIFQIVVAESFKIRKTFSLLIRLK